MVHLGQGIIGLGFQEVAKVFTHHNFELLKLLRTHLIETVGKAVALEHIIRLMVPIVSNSAND